MANHLSDHWHYQKLSKSARIKGKWVRCLPINILSCPTPMGVWGKGWEGYKLPVTDCNVPVMCGGRRGEKNQT